VVPASLIKGKKRPSLQEMLADLPIAVQTTDGEFSRRLREITAKLGIALRPALACQSFPQTARAVRSGLFASILPKLALADFPARTYVLPDEGGLDRLQREIVLAWNPRIAHVRPGATRLLEQMQKILQIGA
jgi:DNA-binding transcriptional LysR family regulator